MHKFTDQQNVLTYNYIHVCNHIIGLILADSFDSIYFMVYVFHSTTLLDVFDVL